MKTIRISGIIASFELENESNVTPATLKDSLDAAGGEDLLITINSPGGSVFEGLEMFSMIRNYPGHTETRPVSLAASMGSVLALAGNKKSIENTAMYLIHNVQGGTYGDYREMSKASKWLEDVTGLLADLYEKHTTLTLKKARNLMDADTHFFGSDLIDLGFELVETGESINQSTARVQAVARLKECEAKISNEEVLNDLEKVAASIAGDKSKNQITNIKPVEAGKNNKEIISMDKEKLKAEFPATYNAIFDAGKAEALDQVNAHLIMGEVSGSLELAVKNIKAGNKMTATINAEYQAEGMKNQDISNRNSDENLTPDTDGSGTGDSGADDEADTKAYADKLGKKMGVK